MTAKEEAVAPLKGTISAPHTAYYGNGTSPPYTGFLPFTSGPPPYNWSGQPFMGLYGNVAFHCMYPYGYVHPTLTAGAVQNISYGILTPSTEQAAPMAEADQRSSLESAWQSKNIADRNAVMGCKNTAKGTSAIECGTGGLSDRSEEDGIANKFRNANLKANSAATCATLSGGLDHPSAVTPIRLQKQGSSDTELSFSNSQLKFHGGHDGTNAEVWSQDNKDTKRQRRKQSNKESARRSRLRKQADCEELSVRVDNLIAENTSLRTELDRLSEECENLFAENASIMKSLCGENAEVIPMLSGQSQHHHHHHHQQQAAKQEDAGSGQDPNSKSMVCLTMT